MSYEGSQVQGKAAIKAEFDKRTWQTIMVSITNADFHPVSDGVLILVTGQMRVILHCILFN